MASQRYQILAALRAQLAAITAVDIARVDAWLLAPQEVPRGLGDAWWAGVRAGPSSATYEAGVTYWQMAATVVLARARPMSAWTAAEHDAGTASAWVEEQASQALDAIKVATAGPGAHTLGGYAIDCRVTQVVDENGLRPAELREMGADVSDLLVYVVARLAIRYTEPQGANPA